MASPVWTNHARDRLSERKISQAQGESTFFSPDTTRTGKQHDTTEFIKGFGSQTVTLIGKQNERNEWVILSVWIDPPVSGTKDHKKKQEWNDFQRNYHGLGFWGKFFYLVRKQLGL